MKHHLIAPPFCQIPDQASARTMFYRRLHRLTRPEPYLILFKDSNFRSICWLARNETEQSNYIVPAFGTHINSELFFEENKRIPLKEGSFFRCLGDYYMVVKDPVRGLCLKQLVIICSQTILETCTAYHQLNGYEFILCKASEISREHTLVAYVWSGYRQNLTDNTHSRILIPVFTEDFPAVMQHDPWDLHYEPLSRGNIIRHGNRDYLIKSDDKGLYVDDLSLGSPY